MKSAQMDSLISSQKRTRRRQQPRLEPLEPRIVLEGQLDSTFGSLGFVTEPLGSESDGFTDLAIDSSGRIVAVGTRELGSVNGSIVVARYLVDGAIDTTFGAGGIAVIDSPASAFEFGTSVVIQPDGAIVVAGGGITADAPNIETNILLARLLDNGSPDPSFGSDGVALASLGPQGQPSVLFGANDLALDLDGSIFVTGSAPQNPTGFQSEFMVAKFIAAGALDPTFGGGIVRQDFEASEQTPSALVVDALTGVVTVAGSLNDTGGERYALIRLLPDGSFDPAFGSDGVVLGPDVGTVMRDALGMTLLDDGGYILVGATEYDSPTSDGAIRRLNPDGSPDPNFGTGGEVILTVPGALDSSVLEDVRQMGQGLIVVGGRAFNSSGSATLLGRFSSESGMIDSTFGTDGFTLLDINTQPKSIEALAFQPSGRIIASGRNGIVGQPVDLGQLTGYTNAQPTNLQLSIASEPIDPIEGDTVTFVITFENLGPTGAVDARVRAVVNPALPLGTVTTTRGTVTVQGNFIDVFLGSFADEPPGEIRIPIPNAPAGTIEVRAEALTFNFDASEGNNAAAARADVLNQISTTQFAVTSVTVSEDAGTLELLVTRSGDTSVDSSVGFFDIPGTALPGVDYVMPANTTLIFPVSSTEQMISIQIIDRMLVQGIRAFDVQLEDPVNTQLGPQSTIRITILESDQLPETNFASPEFVVDEDAGVARLLVRRVGDISQASSVAFVDIPGTALPGVNYIMPTGRLNFAPGQDMNSIDVTIIDNFIQQDVLIFEVMLTDPIGTNIEVDQTRVLIENDDSTIVTNTNDAGRGSLRRAMLVSNATPGLDTIIFEIPSPQGEVQTITPLGPLPVITDPVILNGLSQPGALPPNLGGSSSGGVGLLATAGPLIELSGANLSAGSGLVLAVGNSIIQGLVINRFPEFGIFVTGGAGNTLRANMIGTDPTGTDGRPNREGGIEVTGEGGASTFNLLIASSLISGNGGAGVVLSEGSAASRLEGNFIGTTTSGLARVPNEFHGVVIANSSGNVIGGATPAARNLIGGNGFDPSRNQGVGVYIYNDLREGSGPLLDLAHDNLVIGNWIGLAADGTSGIPGSFVGIVIRNAAGNTIGGETPGAGNVISANFGSGVVLYETEAFRNSPGSGNIVAGNVIGLDATGLQPVLRSPSGESLRRQSAGILIQDSSFNRIGGASPGARNVIAGNGGPGVEIFDDVRTAGTPPATGNVILGNAIGVNRDGEGNDGRNPSVPGFIGNTGDGVFISAASGNTIGGSSTTDQNIIAGNALAGIRLLGRPALGNTIATNLLGQTITGGQTVPLPNGRGDIVLQNTGAASTSALARRLPRLPRRPKIKLIRTAPRAIAAIPRARLRLAQGLPTRPAAKP